MADWLTTVQTKNKLPVASPGVASSGGASPQPQGDWLSTKTSGAGNYRPNQLASEMQPLQPVAPKGNIIAQAGKFVGVTPTNIQKAKDFITKEREPITPEQVVGVGKKFFDVIKQTIVNEKTKQEQKVKDYKKTVGIDEYANLTFEQTRDYVSSDLLKKSKEDIAIDLQKLTGKENKNKLDNYRIKNMQDTLNQIDETLAMQPQQRAKKESFITGLALGRTAGNLAAGVFGSLEGVADFIKWRSDVAGYETLASYSGEGAKRIGQWAEEVAPNNPELADELLQGVGSTLTFYLPGAGVSSASARLASISPKLATIFGITASATLEAATESGSTYQSMLDAGKTREEADLGASRVFAGNIFFNIVSDKVGLFSDAKGVKKAFASALAEGSQEAFQEGLQNIAQEKPVGDNVAKSFFIGSVVGGGLGGVVDRVATDPTINDEDRAKLVQFSAELKKAEQDQEALDKIAEESITPSTEKPESAASEVSSRVENQTVYRGSRGEVTEESKTYERVKVVNTNQSEVIKELAESGNAAAKELYESLPNKDRVDFTIADPIIREAYQNDFDAIQYNNSQASQIGTEYHDLADNRFYAQNRDTAQLYAMQKRAGKYEKPKAQEFDYSSTQLDLPPSEAKGIVDFAQSIPEEQLNKDPADNYAAAQTGRETEPHITVLYGLDTNNESDVRSIVESSQPIEVTLGKLSIFEQEDQDVLKVDISSPELTALNKKLDGELDTPGKTFDDYKPHITIAYLKKGEAAQYVGNTQFEGKKLTLNELTFSGKDGKKVTIPLAGKTENTDINELSDYYNSQDQEKVGQAWYEVMAELEVAEAGQRIFNKDGEFAVGIKSTFPEWIPEELRRRELFDSVMAGISDPTKLQYPPNSQPRKQALYDQILAEIDSRAETDSGDIIERIKQTYATKQTAKQAKKESKATADRSPARSQGAEEDQKGSVSKKETSPNEQGFIDIRGKIIDSEIELASLLKDFRNPKKEVFHLVYVADSKIVSHRVISSKGHDYVNVGEKESFFSIEDRFKRSGAKGFYTVHNHPSGITDPSYDDLRFASSIERKFGNKVISNIILDHDNISIFNENGLVRSDKIDLGIAYGSSEEPIVSPKSVEKFIDSFYQIKDNKIGVLVLNARSQPILIKELNSADLTNIAFAIKQSVKENSGSKAILLTTKKVAEKLLITKNIEATDLVYYDEKNNFVSLRENFGVGFFSRSEGRMEKGDKPIVRKKSLTETKPATKIEDYPSVSSGLQSKGAEKLDNFELRKPPEAGTDEFKLHKKVVELIRKYAQTIGEDYKPRNALGVYYPTTKNIRVNSMNNLSVAAHEIAHFLDYANNITTGLSPAIGSKLGDLYVEYYPGAKPSHKDKLKQLEGFATLLQKYVEMPTTITNKYPELVEHFLKPGGEKYNKVIGDILKDLNDIVSEYQGLSSLDKIGSRMTSEGTNIDKDSFLNFWQKLRTQVFDEIYPAEVLAQKAKVAGTATDPSLWIRAYQSISGVINNNLVSDRGYWGFINLQNGFQKKHSFNWKTLLDSTTNRGITDSFATFLIARREHFYFQELDKLEATRDRLEEISKEYQSLNEDVELDRDIVAELSEDFGIDITELERSEAVEKVQMRFEAAEKEFADLKQILDNDAFDRAEIDAAFEENKDRFADETKMFDVLSREDLDLLHNEDVQLIDNETYSRLKNKEGYASFKRQFYDEIVGEAEATGAVKVGSTKVSSLIARRGSEKTIINPIYSALLNHSEITRKSMRQLVYNQIGKIGSSAVLPTLFQEVPVIPSVDANGRVTFPQEKDPNLIMARDKYKRKAILTDASVKATIDNLLSYKNIDTFVQFYTGLSRMFTAGTTGFYPQFALTNFMVDQITATANSYNKFKPLYTPLAALKAAFQSSKGVNSPEARFYEEYLVMGGERQTFTGWQKLEPDDLFKRITAEKSKMEKAIGLVQKGTDILSIPAAKSELFSRAAEYINARKAGKSQVQALEEAGRVTAPFHHIGAWGAKEGQKSFGATYIRGLPFFNAGLQVLDQTARVAATPSGRQRMTFVTLAVVAAYLTSAMAMGGGSDEQKEQYKDLEAADLASFIYFPNPSGEGLIRVKMSTTFSIPGTLINMVIANKMFSARYEARDVMEAATAWLPTQLQFTKPETILSWLPQIFKPAAYTILNVKDYPTVAPLVNMGLQRKPPALQYNEGTSAFAKKLGELLNVSPIKVDYLLTGYFGRASGFLTGKPGVYNPASSIMRDYYFTSGKRVREFYDISQKVDADYTAYQNWEKGYTDLPKDQVTELYRKKVISDDIDDRLGDYRDLDIEAEPEKAAKLRGEILILIEHLENGTKPRNLGAWSGDAAGRRRKNKPK